MKKFLKFFVLVLIIIPTIFLFTGCVKDDDLDSLRIVSIEQSAYTATTVTYKITYEDGSSFSYEVPLNNVVSIETIEKTSTNNNKDTYTITLTNGNTHTFEVNHGVSVSSIAFSHTEGLIDYYTISYSNGTSSQFSVINGSDGVTLEDLYETANVDGKYSNILEFIEDYLSINVNNNSTTVATGKAIMSAVSVYAFSPVSSSYYEHMYGSKNYYSTSAGAGVVYQLDKEKGDAYIITNCHVVYSENNAMGTDYANKVVCYLYGQESAFYLEEDENGDYVYDENNYPTINYGQYGIECEVIGASVTYDIAVLKVTNSEILKNSNARQIDVANSDKVILSEDAIAIGNPDAEGISVTQGVISVLSEYIQVSIDSTEASTLREFRIDTAVNGGNSGGGLFNSNGELIGIVNAKTSDSSLENFGYAIPSNVAINVADNMIYYYETIDELALKKVYIGITLDVLSSKTEYNSETLSTDIIEEVYIEKIEEGSIAETKFKFKVGDIIKSVTIFDGTSTTVYNITRYHQIIDLVLKLRAGDSITFSCVSGETPVGYTYTIQESDLKTIY